MSSLSQTTKDPLILLYYRKKGELDQIYITVDDTHIGYGIVAASSNSGVGIRLPNPNNIWTYISS